MLTSPGWLFRGGHDAKLRQQLIEKDWVETIIAWPAGMLENTTIACTVLVLNKDKSGSAAGKTQFIDASGFSDSARRPTKLSHQDIDQIVNLIGKSSTISTIVPSDDIVDSNLSVLRYVQSNQELDIPSLEEEQEKLKVAQSEMERAMDDFNECITEIQS